MFLFKLFHLAMIEDGTKTQTRRNHKKFRARVGSVHQVRTELFGKPHCHIRIIRRWEERIGSITHADALAEGGYERENYINGLLEMHQGKLVRNSTVKCYEFIRTEVCPDCGKECGIDNHQRWICGHCMRVIGHIPEKVEEQWNNFWSNNRVEVLTVD